MSTKYLVYTTKEVYVATTRIIFQKDIKKNDREIFRISLDELHGKEFINIRQWFKDPDDDILKPTQKGVYIPAERYDDIMLALEELSGHITP